MTQSNRLCLKRKKKLNMIQWWLIEFIHQVNKFSTLFFDRYLNRENCVNLAVTRANLLFCEIKNSGEKNKSPRKRENDAVILHWRSYSALTQLSCTQLFYTTLFLRNKKPVRKKKKSAETRKTTDKTLIRQQAVE